MVTQVRVSPNPTTTYAARLDYQSSVPLTGLSAGTAYCYEVFGSGTSAVDMLPASQPFQTFTTLDPVDLRSTTPLTFAVVGDFGETSNRGQASDPNANSPTSVNTNQAAIQSLIGSSGARFVISVGDIAYNDGGNYNYGDLQQTGASVGGAGLTEISDIFGASYWPDTVGAATSKAYQVDADAHFQPTSAEYQWLVNDLQTHPGGIKLAFFHYPLRSDNATQDSDVYLQQTLEPLLAKYGVQIAFSGHAHDYERNLTAGPNTILSYVTGGGGGVISTVAGKGCSSWDAYAIGWTYGTGTGQKCGGAPAPTSDSMVYHFLKITIQGNTVVVDPINAAGH